MNSYIWRNCNIEILKKIWIPGNQTFSQSHSKLIYHNECIFITNVKGSYENENHIPIYFKKTVPYVKNGPLFISKFIPFYFPKECDTMYFYPSDFELDDEIQTMHIRFLNPNEKEFIFLENDHHRFIH